MGGGVINFFCLGSAKYTMYTTEKRCDKILNMELIQIKKSFTTFQLEHSEKLRHFTVPVFNELER